MMKKLTGPIVFLAAICIAARAGGAETDWQYWNELVLAWELSERLKSELKSEQVYAENFSRLGMYNIAMGAHFAANNHIYLSAEYMHEMEYDDTDWGKESRYSLVPFAKWSLGKTKFKVKGKVEIRDFHYDAYWRLREFLKITRSVRLGKLCASPFVSDELYHNFNEQRSFQNRFKIGLGAKLGGHLEIIPYYMNIAKNSKENPAWRYVHVLGTEMVFEF